MMAVSCWIAVDDKVGVTNQCIGLAAALGLDYVVKRISTRAPWRYLPLQLWFAPLRSLGPGSDALAPPRPDVLITGGRRPAGLSTSIKRASGGRTYTIQLQDPYVPLRRFDLVITPLHDHCKGDNVVEMTGALHHITAARLAEHIIVTCDSVSIVSEAAATGKPVYVIDLPGGSRKFLEFHATFRREGYTRPFTGTLEPWTHPPYTDMEKAVAEIKRRIGQAGIAGA